MKTRVEICWKESSKVAYILQRTEKDIWEEVGKSLLDIPIPNSVDVYVTDVDDTGLDIGRSEHALLSVTQRGTYAKNNVRVPSMYVKCELNEITAKPSQYEEAYLTCINPESNNYKFYDLIPIAGYDGNTKSVTARYGRIGAEAHEMYGERELSIPYPSYMYMIRYYEKLSKGYKDESDVFLAPEATEEQAGKVHVQKKRRGRPRKINPISQKLYSFLSKIAVSYVTEVTTEPQKVTAAQLIKARELIDKLVVQTDLKSFNDVLTDLLVLVPRKTRYVNMQLAVNKDDFDEIISREESLFNAMEAMVSKNENTEPSTTEDFRKFNIDVSEPTEQEREKIKSLFIPEMQCKIEDIYMVTPKAQKKIFNNYVKEHNIKNKKLLMHGSRNENWFSIVKNSLSLHPNAIRTGSGLGNGLYFGNNSIKCSHYTFSNSGKIIIGVFECAYGTPKKVYDYGYNEYKDHTQEELDKEHKNCIHYHREGCDWADEIVFYNEQAVVLKSIVVLKK